MLPAYSAAPVDGVGFVQHRLWAERKRVVELVRAGATFYVCGDGRAMAPAVRDTCVRIYAEETGASPDEAEAWLDEMEREQGRYVVDALA